MALFNLDPRIGLFFRETIVRRAEHFPAILNWLSAIALVAIGIYIVRAKCGTGVYLLAELFLAVPSVLFFVNIAAADFCANHGFSRNELVHPVASFTNVTLIPVGLAVASNVPRPKLSSVEIFPK